MASILRKPILIGLEGEEGGQAGTVESSRWIQTRLINELLGRLPKGGQ
jgi:hypothetical protein